MNLTFRDSPAAMVSCILLEIFFQVGPAAPNAHHDSFTALANKADM